MKRVLIDLTDVEGWHGHYGGTQRVVYGIAKQFYMRADKDLQVEFIAYSARQNLFYATSFTPIFDRVENEQVVLPAEHAQLSAVSRAKQFVQPYVPEKLRKNKYARASAKNTLRIGRGIVRRARQKIREHGPSLKSPSRGQRITFTENDIVLVLGKPWDSPGMERTLINEKTKKGFVLAQVVYDLIIPLYPHLHHPSLFKDYTQYIFEAVYGSDLLLPISKSTDKDLKLFAKSLNLPTPKTKVIRLADEIVNLSGETTKPDARIANAFIVCIGTVEIRKNHTLLYYAYKLAERQGIKLPQLVIVGSRGWLSGDFQYLVEHDPHMKNKIIILDNVNDQSLSWIYGHCMFSVYPSFYEGWGLPVAESLANGKVCIASNTSSIPEICGDMIDYFSPYNAQACLDQIVKYLNPTVLQKKEAQIKETYTPTSWEDTFHSVTDGIDKL